MSSLPTKVARELAYGLHTLGERKKRGRALSYNDTLVWPNIARLAAAPRSGKQAELL